MNGGFISKHIHRILDPLWESGKVQRGKLYAKIANELGIAEYHTAEIMTIEEARKVYAVVKEF